MSASIKEETVFNLSLGYRHLGRFTREELVELRTVIDRTLSDEVTAYQWERIVIAVCGVCDVKRASLSGKTRPAQVAFARQLAMYLIYEHTDLSNSKVGKLFGGRDPTTVVHARRVIEARRNTYDEGRLIRSVEAALAAQAHESIAAPTNGNSRMDAVNVAMAEASEVRT
jgi:hypothetical protein